MGLALEELKIAEQVYEVDGIELMIADDLLSFARNSRIEYIGSPARQGFAIIPARGQRC